MSSRLWEWIAPAESMRMIQAQTTPMTQEGARLATSPTGTSIASRIESRERLWFQMKLSTIQLLPKI